MNLGERIKDGFRKKAINLAMLIIGVYGLLFAIAFIAIALIDMTSVGKKYRPIDVKIANIKTEVDENGVEKHKVYVNYIIDDEYQRLDNYGVLYEHYDSSMEKGQIIKAYYNPKNPVGLYTKEDTAPFLSKSNKTFLIIGVFFIFVIGTLIIVELKPMFELKKQKKISLDNSKTI